MSSHNQTLPLPPGFDKNLATSTFLSSAPSADEANTEGDDFINECLDWLDKWSEEFADKDKSSLKPSLLVFDPTKLYSQVIPGSNRHVAFKHTVEFGIGSKIYSCTSNLSQVHSIEAIITDASSALLQIESLSLTQAYVVIWMPNELAALVVEPGGDIETPRRVKMMRQSSADFDFTTLDSHLEVFYEDHVATHEGDCDIWHLAAKREIRVEAERLICKSLHGFFRHSVLPRSATIDREVQTYQGREDIRILRINKVTNELETAILELKVLRMTDSEKKALTWAKKGVIQTLRYSKTDSKTKEKFVCIYDGRTKDDPMPDGVKFATQNNVKWRRYFMTTPGCPKTQVGHLT